MFRQNLQTILLILLLAWVGYDTLFRQPKSVELLRQATAQAQAALSATSRASAKIDSASKLVASCERQLSELRSVNEKLINLNDLAERRYQTLLISRRKRLNTYLDSARHELESLQNLQKLLK